MLRHRRWCGRDVFQCRLEHGNFTVPARFELWELCFSITLGIPTVLSSVLNLENLDLLDPFITFLLNDRLLSLRAESGE